MYKYLSNIYKDKRVFITGHTGFKGSWLVKLLMLLGAEIKGYALNPETDNDLFFLLDGNKICDSNFDDIRNRNRLAEELVSFQPDYIFHLAAQPLVKLSYEIPMQTFEVNAIGTANLLDAVRILDKKCHIVLITTDKVYHNNEWVYPYRESDRLGGYDPYSASKACAELVIDSYRNSFFNIHKYAQHKKSLAVTRAGNVIGGGDWSQNRLIPDIMKSLLNEETINIRNPSAIRPWQHVLDPLTGYLLLGAYMEKNPICYSDAYNFGPMNEDILTVEEMVKLVIQKWGKGKYNIVTAIDQTHEAGILKLDISKVLSQIDWKPRYTALQAVNATVDWYKHFSDEKSTINAFTEMQIKDFIQYE